MTSQEIADAAVAGSWSVLCGHMELRRADDALVVSGSGKIGYDSDGVLGFTLIVDEEKVRAPEGPVGQLVSDSSYLRLNALDENGRYWRSPRVLVDHEEWRSRVEVRRSALWQIESTRHGDNPVAEETLGTRLLFPEAVHLRHNCETTTTRRVGTAKPSYGISWAASEIAVADYALTISEEGRDSLALAIESKAGSVTRNTEARAVEALRFVTARPLSWVVAERSGPDWEQIELRRRVVRGRPGRWLPPLPVQLEHPWSMFARYFAHVITNDVDLHQLSVRVDQVVEGSYWGAALQAVILAAAVEGVLSSEFAGLEVPPTVSPDEQEAAIAVVEAASLSDSVRRRLLHRAKELTAVTPTAKLRALVTAGVCTKREVDSYLRLRNSHVHGGTVTARATPEGVDDLLSSLTLFHRLVLAAIGYSGPMRDYAPPADDTERWTTVQVTAPCLGGTRAD
jgi:hypothetical protein